MKIEAQEYLARVNALRAKMAENDVDLVVGFSNHQIHVVFSHLGEYASCIVTVRGVGYRFEEP